MTKNQARKENEKLNEKIAETAQANRDKAAKNSEAMADGTAFVYGPIHTIDDEKVEITLPTGAKKKMEMVVARFDGEIAYFDKRKDANEWVKAKKKAWTEKNGKMLSAKKLKTQIAANVKRLAEILEKASGLPQAVTEPLTIAHNKLKLACDAIPEPEKKEKKEKKEKPAA